MTQGFEQCRVEDMKNALIRNGYEGDIDELKGKSNVTFALIKLADTMNVDPHSLLDGSVVDDDNEAAAEVDFSHVEIEDDSEQNIPGENHSYSGVEEWKNEALTPTYDSPNWSDYVLSQFENDELGDGKNPTVPGMRRLLQKLLGDTVFTGPVQTSQHYPENPLEVGRASCIYEIRVEWRFGMIGYIAEGDVDNYSPPVRVFRASAGSYLGNTDNDFAIYPEAIAETRAESRALRKALGLKNVVAHEELTSKDARESVEASTGKVVKSEEWCEDDSISGGQKAMIETKCEALGIDVDRFINLAFYEGREQDKQFEDIGRVPRGTAAHMVARLTQYQTEAGDESRKIPEVILLENANVESI